MNELHIISTKAVLRALCPVPRKARGGAPHVRQRIVGTLALASGHMVTRRELVDAVYGDLANGGPDDPERIIKVLIHHLRREGWPIHSHWGRGYSLATDRREEAAE